MEITFSNNLLFSVYTYHSFFFIIENCNIRKLKYQLKFDKVKTQKYTFWVDIWKLPDRDGMVLFLWCKEVISAVDLRECGPGTNTMKVHK